MLDPLHPVAQASVTGDASRGHERVRPAVGNPTQGKSNNVGNASAVSREPATSG